MEAASDNRMIDRLVIRSLQISLIEPAFAIARMKDVQIKFESVTTAVGVHARHE